MRACVDRAGTERIGGGVGIGLSQIKHVKLPVADLRRSASWYRGLFDLELIAESAAALQAATLCQTQRQLSIDG
jgi:hypothetical protein